MKKEKIVVPSREERMAELGDPKTPKMGKLTPQTVKVPSVDNLIDRLQKATAPAVPESTVRVRFMPPENGFKFISFDLGAQSKTVYGDGRCNHGCSCPPCRRGECGRCTVDALFKEGRDRKTVRAAATKYRGVVFS